MYLISIYYSQEHDESPKKKQQRPRLRKRQRGVLEELFLRSEEAKILCQWISNKQLSSVLYLVISPGQLLSLFTFSFVFSLSYY